MTLRGSSVMPFGRVSQPPDRNPRVLRRRTRANSAGVTQVIAQFLSPVIASTFLSFPMHRRCEHAISARSLDAAARAPPLDRGVHGAGVADRNTHGSGS